MKKHMQFDAQDRAAFAALDDDFAIGDGGDVATVTGEMSVEILHALVAAENHYRLRLSNGRSVIVSATPGDRRLMRHARMDVRRAEEGNHTKLARRANHVDDDATAV